MDKRYPDLALLAQPARRAICCLAVEGGGEKIEGLLNRKPFSRYAENGLTVLLYDEAQSEAWRAEIERILAESGLCAGLSGPFALAASARGCFPKARIALETGRTVDPGRALYDMGTYSASARGSDGARGAGLPRVGFWRRGNRSACAAGRAGGCAVYPQPARVFERWAESAARGGAAGRSPQHAGLPHAPNRGALCPRPERHEHLL